MAFFPVNPILQFVLFAVFTVLLVIAFSRFLVKALDENVSVLRSLSYLPLVIILSEISIYCLWRLVSPIYTASFRDFSEDITLTWSIVGFLFLTYDLWAHNRVSKRDMVMLTAVNAAIIAFVICL
ncbi:hypothetical protein [Methanosarcina sp.]|uniref:hypothetical protein n=1 Tax=Methanosarcina sp. TaxID=2213 RepID=UPI003C70A372